MQMWHLRSWFGGEQGGGPYFSLTCRTLYGWTSKGKDGVESTKRFLSPGRIGEEKAESLQCLCLAWADIYAEA